MLKAKQKRKIPIKISHVIIFAFVNHENSNANISVTKKNGTINTQIRTI